MSEERLSLTRAPMISVARMAPHAPPPGVRRRESFPFPRGPRGARRAMLPPAAIRRYAILQGMTASSSNEYTAHNRW